MREEPVETRVDKENAVLSVGLLMNSIRPKSTVQPGEMRSVKKAGDHHLSGDNPDLLGRRNRYRCHGKTA